MARTKGNKVGAGSSKGKEPVVEPQMSDNEEEENVALDPRFDDLEVQAIFRRFGVRAIHKERPILIRKPSGKALLRFHKWQPFLEEPHKINPFWVQEFYASGLVRQRIKQRTSSYGVPSETTVRRRTVTYDEYAIRECLGLAPRPPVCAYNELVRNHYRAVDLAVVLQELAEEGTVWVNNTMFKASGLKNEGKFWYEFVRHCIMPSMNKSEVSKDRAVLVYAILQRIEIDTVQLISSALQTQIKRLCGELSRDNFTAPSKKKTPFIFPSLISNLCERASVEQYLEKSWMRQGFFWSTPGWFARLRETSDLALSRLVARDRVGRPRGRFPHSQLPRLP